MKKVFGKEVLILFLSLTALVCASVSLNNSLNQFMETEQDEDLD